MTTFSEAFRSTRDLCISQGRKPVVCLLGPDFQEKYIDFIEGEWVDQTTDYNALNGIRIRPMKIHGLAMVTAPMPESGFDLP